MKKIIWLLSFAVLLTLSSAVPVNAGEVERSVALENLTTAEIRVYVGNSGTIGMDGTEWWEKAAHPSMLYRLLDGKAGNDNSLSGSTDELISELSSLEDSISGLIAEDNDLEIIQAESEAATGFTFTERLDILRAKMEEIAEVIPDCGINNIAQEEIIAQRAEIVTEAIVSTMEVFGVVVFPDPKLEAAIRTKIGKPTGDILASDLEALTSLSAASADITNLSGIEYCVNLYWLYLGNNQISDLSPLAGLTKLEILYLQVNQISDLSPLAGLTNLEILYLHVNQISDISPLLNIDRPDGWLWYLELVGNPLSSDSINVYIPELQDNSVFVYY